MAKTSKGKLSRRALLATTAGAVGAKLLPAQDNGDKTDTTKVQGELAREVGERSPHEAPKRTFFSSTRTASNTPLQDLEGIITPADLHFERHHAGIPQIDPDDYSLLIHGMVERPRTYTLAELKRFPAVAKTYFLECSGNGFRTFRNPENHKEETVQEVEGLTSTSEWIGVPVATLFKEVGVHPDAKWFLAESMDGAAMTRSVPVEKGWDDALIAYGQNGEAIRPEQGYPARLFLPGFEGSSNVKWIRRIEVARQALRNHLSRPAVVHGARFATDTTACEMAAGRGPFRTGRRLGTAAAFRQDSRAAADLRQGRLVRPRRPRG